MLEKYYSLASDQFFSILLLIKPIARRMTKEPFDEIALEAMDDFTQKNS